MENFFEPRRKKKKTDSNIMILLATPSNTSPLERSYSFLQMVCSPRRNQLSPKSIETLYLLATLKLPVKGSAEYVEEIKILEK